MENELFLSNFQTVLKNHLFNWADVMQSYAINLFFILASIALIVNIILTILESGGSVDINKILAFILKFSFITGFFYFLLKNGIELANGIIQYFLSIGNDSLQYGSDNKGAVENILNSIYILWKAILNGVSIFDPADSLGLMLLGIIIVIIMIIILGNYLVEVASAFILVYAGYIVLAFGATQWTREWVINYFKAVFGIGLKILTLLFLIGVTLEFLEMQIGIFKNNNNFTLSNGITILITVFILMMIMNKVPDAIASLVSGAWGHMSGLNMATAAATVMAAAQTAKTAVSIMSKTGGAMIEGAKNYKRGADDYTTDYINKKYPDQAKDNQNNTVNNSLSNDNKNKGLAYNMGRATGFVAGKYADFKEKLDKNNDNKHSNTENK